MFNRRRRWCSCACASVASVAHLALSLFLVVFTQKETKETSVSSLIEMIHEGGGEGGGDLLLLLLDHDGG